MTWSSSFHELRVDPGKSLGPFSFGISISDVFEYIRKKSSELKSNDFKYNEMEPFSMSYVIHLHSLGLDLRFNPKSQRLEEIQICDLNKVDLTIGIDHLITLSTPNAIPTLNTIHEKLGPTVSGHLMNDNKEYVIEYTDAGLEFTFNVAEPLGNSLLKSIVTRSLKTFSEDIVTYIIGKGIKIHTETYHINDDEITIRNERFIPFGASVQEVIKILGKPQEKFYKYSDSFPSFNREYLNHDSDSSDSFILTTRDYFFNYFKLGMDILFDGRTHLVKKFILWTNLPTHPQFITYSKCHFKIECKKANENDDVNNNNENVHYISCDDKLGDIKNVFGEPMGDPYDYLSSNSKFYGYKDIIFEVAHNDYISRVILFQGIYH